MTKDPTIRGKYLSGITRVVVNNSSSALGNFGNIAGLVLYETIILRAATGSTATTFDRNCDRAKKFK